MPVSCYGPSLLKGTLDGVLAGGLVYGVFAAQSRGPSGG
jgi:hypothetical protein